MPTNIYSLLSNKRVPVIVIVAGMLLMLLVQIRLWNYVADDTYISLHYSRNLAEGKGLVFNTGEHVDGYTNFLWVIYLTIPFLLHIDPIIFLKVTNIFLICFTAVLIYGIGKKTYFKKSPNVALIPSLLFLTNPLIEYSSAEGLETIFFIFLLILAVFLFVRERKNSFPYSVLAVTALALTRPDGIIFMPLFVFGAYLRKMSNKYIIEYLLFFLTIFLPLFIWHYSYYGYLFPNTLYAKPGGSWNSIIKSLHILFDFLKTSMIWILVLYLPPILIKRLRGIILLFGGIILVRVLFHIWSGGAIMGIFRFLVPMLPFAYMIIVAGIIFTFKKEKLRDYTLCIVTGILLIGWIWYPKTERQLLQYAQGLQKAHIALAHVIRKYTDPHTVITLGDVGALPFYSGRTTVDMLGLTDSHFAHIPGDYAQKLDQKYLLSRQPDIVILTSHDRYSPSLTPNSIGTGGGLFPYPPFQKLYSYIGTYTYTDGYYLLVYGRNGSKNLSTQFIREVSNHEK